MRLAPNIAVFPGRKKTIGFTLTEIAVVLAVAGLILGAVWVIGGQVYLNNHVRLGTQELTAIVQNVRTVFAEQPGVTGGSSTGINQSLDQLKVFPLEMRQYTVTPQPNGVLFHPWAQIAVSNGGGFPVGSVQVYADDCTGNESDLPVAGQPAPMPCFGVRFIDLPQNACIGMLNSTTQSGTGLVAVLINGVAVAALPVSASTAGTSCGNTNGSGSNDVWWIFRLRANN